MKKSLLALALLGAFAGAAQAQTNVTLYGLIDLGVQFNDAGTDDDNWALESGNQSASRWGIKGTEDLGSGLKASFVLEGGFDADTGDLATEDRLFSRLSYVGLGGGFGEVRLGRQVTPFKAAVDAIDVFAGAGQNAIYDYVGTGDAAFTAGDFERRSNQLTYLAPKFGGFTAQAAYAFSEERGAFAGAEGAPRSVGFQAGYGNGPITAQFGYAQDRTGTDTNTSVWTLGAVYNLGVAKIHAGYIDGEGEVAGADAGDVRAFFLGTSLALGTGTLQAQWVRNDDRDLDDGVTNTVQLGYSHPISKRTNLYTMLTHVRNDDDSRLLLADEADAGENANIVSVGVRHTF